MRTPPFPCTPIASCGKMWLCESVKPKWHSSLTSSSLIVSITQKRRMQTSDVLRANLYFCLQNVCNVSATNGGCRGGEENEMPFMRSSLHRNRCKQKYTMTTSTTMVICIVHTAHTMWHPNAHTHTAQAQRVTSSRQHRNSQIILMMQSADISDGTLWERGTSYLMASSRWCKAYMHGIVWTIKFCDDRHGFNAVCRVPSNGMSGIIHTANADAVEWSRVFVRVFCVGCTRITASEKYGFQAAKLCAAGARTAHLLRIANQFRNSSKIFSHLVN